MKMIPRLTRRLLVVLTALACAAGLSGGAPAAASPATQDVTVAAQAPPVLLSGNPYECPSDGAICGWTDAYAWGSRCQWHISSIRGGKNIGSACNNRISSIWNRSGYPVTFFRDSYCKGPALLVGVGEYISDLDTTNFNDALSSLSRQYYDSLNCGR